MHPFSYFRARNLHDVHAALRQEGTRVLAGGTTLYDLMKLDIEKPERVVDISHLVPEPVRIENDVLIVDSLMKMSEAADSRILSLHAPAVREALLMAASQQLRNMASLGGNILQRTRCSYFRHSAYPCNKKVPGSGCAALEGLNRNHALFGGSESCIAVYPGDFAVALMAFDARIEVVGNGGARQVLLSDVHREPGDAPHLETNLQPDELIKSVHIPLSESARASTYLKIRDRESYAFAVVSAAVGVELEGNLVKDVRIALGGVATRPWRAIMAEQSLIGRSLDGDTALAAGRTAFAGAATTAHNAFKTELGARVVADALVAAKTRV
ncbi:FAD binding domain-containing protein [Agrobacterium pusense]|uniref:FAD binding domain-containing protein n=1 Tax=Agrobacterium pusense TaxID=648995 RepID=UPI0005EFC39B|nr:xanthine dehydrogenase family protein subunit M [Agrobacterium pusense]NTE48124.1 xanthine dehydrogenase family protein subunit M [Agrobacterium pusense]